MQIVLSLEEDTKMEREGRDARATTSFWCLARVFTRVEPFKSQTLMVDSLAIKSRFPQISTDLMNPVNDKRLQTSLCSTSQTRIVESIAKLNWNQGEEKSLKAFIQQTLGSRVNFLVVEREIENWSRMSFQGAKVFHFPRANRPWVFRDNFTFWNGALGSLGVGQKYLA